MLCLSASSQTNTVGVLHLTDSVSDGYTLFTPEKNNSVYLINNCGEIMNEWTFSERPANTCYLLENGNLLRPGKNMIEIRDWNNQVLWSVSKASLNVKQHHDIEPLPNGNILLLLKDGYPDTTMISNGRDRTFVASTFYFDRIVEIEPIGIDSAIIVWDWTFFDHLIQDYDSTKLNFGNVANHPELLDLNFNNGQIGDFTHCNSIDYNEELDQILLSVRHFDELMIIDHSTTTLQASGHTGGNSNRGGDIIWRWGNPQTYRQGTVMDKKLFLQHDGKWVDSGFVNEGKISVFNNSIDSTLTWSSVHIIEPSFNSSTNLYTKTANKFNPSNFHFSWSDSILGNVFYESNKSGVQATEAGNMLICETKKGQITEISPSGNNLWTYKNPSGLIVYSQFDTVQNNTLFRATKYPKWYPGLLGKNLTSQGLIEDVNTISDSCYLYAGIEETIYDEKIWVFNPVFNGEIRFINKIVNGEISLFDISGRKIGSYSNFNGEMLKTDLDRGIYIITIKSFDLSGAQKIIVQ